MSGLAGAPVPGWVWTLVIPAPCAWISANRQLHWAQRDALGDQWRRAAYLAGLAAWRGRGGEGPPKGMAYARVDLHLHFRDRRRRDTANYELTGKAVVDALGQPFVRAPTARQPKGRSAPGLGWLLDDDPAHLDGPHVTVGELWQQVCLELPSYQRYGHPGGITITLSDLSGHGGQDDAGT